MTIQKDLKELRNKVEKLEKENKQLKKQIKTEKHTTKDEENTITRRSFLKKLGLGAITLGALSIPTVSALDIKSGQGLQVYEGGTQYLDVNPNGPVEITNTNLNLKNNNIKNVNQLNGQNADDLGGLSTAQKRFLAQSKSD